MMAIAAAIWMMTTKLHESIAVAIRPTVTRAVAATERLTAMTSRMSRGRRSICVHDTGRLASSIAT
jgi:hypothetical protein